MDQRTGTTTNRVLPAVIVVLVLGDAAVHLYLVFAFFRGNFLANDLSTLFALNFLGYVLLTVAFLLSPRWLGEKRWLMNLVLILYVAATLVLWVGRGAPNPRGLGYLSKGVEGVLLIALLAHLKGLRPARRIGRTDVARGA